MSERRALTEYNILPLFPTDIPRLIVSWKLATVTMGRFSVFPVKCGNL